jgi:hypothetical protein
VIIVSHGLPYSKTIKTDLWHIIFMDCLVGYDPTAGTFVIEIEKPPQYSKIEINGMVYRSDENDSILKATFSLNSLQDLPDKVILRGMGWEAAFYRDDYREGSAAKPTIQ